MALSNQGFELEFNLSESVDDGQILNNLADGNIRFDIALFRNNRRNVSTLLWEYNQNSSSITDNRFIFPDIVQFVFTNGDMVTVQGTSLGNLNATTTYYVVDLIIGTGVASNQLGFGLATTKGGTRIALGTIQQNVTFIRNDEVTKDDIINIALPDTLEQGRSASSFQGDVFRYNIGATFNIAFETIDSNIDSSTFIRAQKYTTNESVSTDKIVSIEGSLVVQDPADYNTNSTNFAQQKSPGIFIADQFATNVNNISKIRAFSSNRNPWEIVSNTLVTEATEVSVNELYFQDDIKIASFDGLETVSGSVLSNSTGFTHKLPVTINGVEYFLLVKSI